MKNEILGLMKEQLTAITTELSYDNLKDMEAQIARVFTILESAETMMDTPVYRTSAPDDEKHTVYPPLIAKILNEESDTPTEDYPTEKMLIDDEEEEDELALPSDVYRFERRIKGGWVEGIRSFVPERAVREKDLENGDMVRAKFLFQPYDGPARYEFELAERANPPEPTDNIIEINMGIVSYHPNKGGLCIDRTVTSDVIIHHGEEVVLPINEEDSNYLNLVEGDIVNAAFYNDNTDFCRIRWKYSIEEAVQEQQSPRRNASYYKKKNDSEEEDVEQIFAGKTIGCMGYEPGWAAFREEVEKRGGEFLGMTGRETDETLASLLRKSDCLVMVLLHVGHAGTKFANAFCKEHNIPYSDIRNFGRTTFVNTAAHLLQK